MSKFRQKLLGSKPPRETITVEIEGETLTVEVRGLSSGAALELQQSCTVTTKNDDGEEVEKQDLRAMTPALLIATLYDAETGQPMFSVADRDAILEVPMSQINPLVEAATRVSGMTKKVAEQAEKN
jgi:hypothetical protein